MMRKALYYFTPCVLAALFLLVVIIQAFVNENVSEGWSMLVVYLALPYLGVIIIMDIVAKIFIKKELVTLWLTETLLLLLSIFIIYLINK